MQTDPEGFCVKQPHITHSVVARRISDHTQLQTSTLSSLCVLEGCTSTGLPWLCTNYARQLCTSRKPKHRHRVCVRVCVHIYRPSVMFHIPPLSSRSTVSVSSPAATQGSFIRAPACDPAEAAQNTGRFSVHAYFHK